MYSTVSNCFKFNQNFLEFPFIEKWQIPRDGITMNEGG